MDELRHECGIAAVYHLAGRGTSSLCPSQGPEEASRLMPRMLLDIQNRGQLSAGMTTFNPNRNQLIDTLREMGTVSEVFRMNHSAKFESLMREYAGRAAIGHVRYATCGAEDRSYAQPFERHHIQKSKWFSFAFNGQLANYPELRDEVLEQPDYHLARQTDTEIIMHSISRELSGDHRPRLLDVFSSLTRKFDGAYNIVFLDAVGDMIVARDPLGIRPLCYAIDGPLFAAASESVALANLGFSRSSIRSLEPGHAVVIENNALTIEPFAESPRRAHCFFEWIYFANVASTLDERSVYLSRKALGEELAQSETVTLDEDTIVVPVPDTAKAAAASMAFQLGVPCLEGLMRNRYVGRTFIEGAHRAEKVRLKYTPLHEVLEGKRVLLVEDTIVRSTTLQTLVNQVRVLGGAKEIHVRVACPPILAPCFYGIDMSTVDELIAPRFFENGRTTDESQQRLADSLGADSLRYLPVASVARAIGLPEGHLCRACITGMYPTPAGEKLYQIALANNGNGSTHRRTYDVKAPLGEGR